MVGAGTVALGATTITAGKGGENDLRNSYSATKIVAQRAILGTSKKELTHKPEKSDHDFNKSKKWQMDLDDATPCPKYRRESLDSVFANFHLLSKIRFEL